MVVPVKGVGAGEAAIVFYWKVVLVQVVEVEGASERIG